MSQFTKFRPISALLVASLWVGALSASAQVLKERDMAYAATAKPLKTAWSVSSKPTQTVMMELFTSLYCPACPPAEAWLGSFAMHDLQMKNLKSDEGLWKDIVPIAWHVTSFDRPGRKDPLSQETWSTRQSYFAQKAKKDMIYTPAFYINGNEWDRQEEPKANMGETGVLKLSNKAGGGLVLEFDPVKELADQADKLELTGHVVLQVNGIHTNPRQRKGSQEPPQDFAVVELHTERLKKQGDKWVVELPAVSQSAVLKAWPDAQLSLAAWVSVDRYGLVPVQSVGTWVK